MVWLRLQLQGRGNCNGNEYLPKNMAQPHTIQIDASESADFELLRSHQWYNDGCYCCVFTSHGGGGSVGRLQCSPEVDADLNLNDQNRLKTREMIPCRGPRQNLL